MHALDAVEQKIQGTHGAQQNKMENRDFHFGSLDIGDRKKRQIHHLSEISNPESYLLAQTGSATRSDALVNKTRHFQCLEANLVQKLRELFLME